MRLPNWVIMFMTHERLRLLRYLFTLKSNLPGALVSGPKQGSTSSHMLMSQRECKQ